MEIKKGRGKVLGGDHGKTSKWACYLYIMIYI